MTSRVAAQCEPVALALDTFSNSDFAVINEPAGRAKYNKKQQREEKVSVQTTTSERLSSAPRLY